MEGLPMASTYKLHRTQLLQSNEMYCIHSESIHSESPCLTDHALGNLLVGQANLFVAGGARPHDVTVIAGRGHHHWWAHGKGTKPQQQWFAEKLGRELQVEGDKGEYRK